MTPERQNKLLHVLHKRQANLTVMLENVSDPHNVSAVLRTCDAVGIQDVYILNNKIPPHKRWGFRSSSGAYKWLTTHQFTDAEACINQIRQGYTRILTTRLSPESLSVFDIDFTGSIALVFGNENDGVSDEVAALADGNFVIPQTGIISSLNISVACAVTLYEAYRQKDIAGHYNQPSLPAHQLDTVMKAWGFIDNEIVRK